MKATVIVLGLTLLFPGTTFGAQSVKRTQPIVYVALGDSITWGLSASKTCQPQTPTPVQAACADATSFPAVLARTLQARGHDVRIQNLAISGARIAWVWAYQVNRITPKANLITLFIGTNDFVDVGSHGPAVLKQFAIQYGTLISYLHAHFARARILLLNVPNMGYLPCCAVMRPAFESWKIVNTLIDAFAGKATIVDLVCDGALYNPRMFPAADAVHPSDAGHARIAADILKALASPKKPAASCPPYF